MNRKHDTFCLTPVGESALLLSLGAVLTPEVNARIRSLDIQLHQRPLEGILEWVPGYTSLMVFYDPGRLGVSRLQSHLVTLWEESESYTLPPPKQITIPVIYGGESGPDLAWLADFHGLSAAAVVRLHTAPTYLVGMMGFTPGFAYLLGLDPLLAAPRRETPRTLVPAGSVGIAGLQTGIYPLDSPGGWQLIGKTDQRLYDQVREQPFLLSPGDEVIFMPQSEGVMP
jgi:inhibitor of KinA